MQTKDPDSNFLHIYIIASKYFSILLISSHKSLDGIFKKMYNAITCIKRKLNQGTAKINEQI